MIKTILAPLSGLGSDDVALETAYRTAHLFGAHIECLHVRPGAFEMVRGMPIVDGSTTLAMPEIWQAIEAEAKTRAQSARKSFDTFSKRNEIVTVTKPTSSGRVTAEWHEVEGNQRKITLQRARYNELVVFSHGSAGFDPLLDDVGEILVGCGRPLLIAPMEAPQTIATTVAIAWKETAEAARAVTAAMPLLKKAQKLLIFAAAEDLATKAIEEMERLASALRWDGFAPDVHCLVPEGSGVPDTVLKAAHQHKADLLVMGGYGHSRAREFVLGGFTQHALRKANLPVFLFH